MTKILVTLSTVAVAAVLALIPTILIYWLWDPIITSVFPGAVESGYVTDQINFLHSLGLSIICGLLFKSTSSPD